MGNTCLLHSPTDGRSMDYDYFLSNFKYRSQGVRCAAYSREQLRDSIPPELRCIQLCQRLSNWNSRAQEDSKLVIPIIFFSFKFVQFLPLSGWWEGGLLSDTFKIFICYCWPKCSSQLSTHFYQTELVSYQLIGSQTTSEPSQHLLAVLQIHWGVSLGWG